METWRAVVGFERLYEVSDLGRVRSLDRVVQTGRGERKYKGRLLKRIKHNSGKGRSLVGLSRRGEQRLHLVAHLVADAFLGPRPPGTVLRHLNDDPGDDRAENLMYGTYSDNAFDRVRNGSDHETGKTHCPRGHVLALPNLVASFARRGHRSCLACARARANCQRWPELDFATRADEHYAKIMGAHAE
jgi:hypothetical protein